MKIKSEYQSIRDKKRLVIYLLKLSTRGQIVKTNLRKLLKDIFEATGEIFAKTEYGIQSGAGWTELRPHRVAS